MRWSAVLFAAAALIASGCSGSSGEDTTGPTTSFPYLVDPLEPGTGFVQLGANRYPFDGVICATGPVKSDPEGSTRIFGVYANFEVDGSLAAVSLTRYHNEVHDKIDTIPTVTETALIQMQGEGEVRGLSARRFQVVGAKKWTDPEDPTATTPLITRDGDRYEATGRFGALDGTDDTADATAGKIAARCPSDDGAAGSAGTTGSSSPTTSVASDPH